MDVTVDRGLWDRSLLSIRCVIFVIIDHFIIFSFILNLHDLIQFLFYFQMAILMEGFHLGERVRTALLLKDGRQLRIVRLVALDRCPQYLTIKVGTAEAKQLTLD